MNWSQVVYGAAKIHNLSPKTSYELLSRIHGFGCREIDTAPSYGNSETLLGSFLEDFPDFKVNTKVGTNQTNQFTSTSIKESVYKSLESLKISCINTLFIHSVPPHLITNDVLKSLRELKEENICKSIGYSGDGIDLKSEFLRGARNYDTFMLSYNILDQANKETTESHGSQQNVYLKRVLANSVWRKRSPKDITKDLLGRSRGHDEYRKRLKILHPNGIEEGYALSLDFVSSNFPEAKYVIGISNVPQCQELAGYIEVHKEPDLDRIEKLVDAFKRCSELVELKPVT